MSQVQEARCRIDIRVPLSVRNMIDRASSLQGRTRTDFIIATLVEKAKAMIEEETVIRLSLAKRANAVYERFDARIRR